MKELQSIQLERGLRIVDSPGVIFDDNEGIQGQKESSVLLRNVVRPDDIDDPISAGGCTSFPQLPSVLSLSAQSRRSLHDRKLKD